MRNSLQKQKVMASVCCMISLSFSTSAPVPIKKDENITHSFPSTYIKRKKIDIPAAIGYRDLRTSARASHEVPRDPCKIYKRRSMHLVLSASVLKAFRRTEIMRVARFGHRSFGVMRASGQFAGKIRKRGTYEAKKEL